MLDVASERAYPTPAANSPLLPLLLLSLMKHPHSPKISGMRRKEYDYIVVGSGSGGATVAGRLSEKSCMNILLLEAGKAPPILTEVPAFTSSFSFTDLSWKYKTVPQKHAASGIIGQQVLQPTGKVLGGCSTFNLMEYVRGNKKNYDDWAEQGAVGWNYTNVLPYFLKAEGNRNIEDLDEGYHSDEGPLTVERQNYQGETYNPIIEATKELEYEIVDSNGRRQTGFFDVQLTTRDGQRCSTAKAYLVPAENNTNLDILTEAFVTKIVIKKGRAVGVIFEYRNLTHYVKANKEVILSAGTVNSPQLLMLSGIGPRSHLEKLGIPVIADLPVGNNLQDHCAAYTNFVFDTSIKSMSDKLSDDKNIEQYIESRSGPLASGAGFSFLAFLNSDKVDPEVDFPNYQLYLLEGSTDFYKNVVNLKPEVYRQVFEPYENKTFFTCSSQVTQPRSRGTIRLHSADPRDPPLINPNYFKDVRDLEDIVEGMKTCKKIGTSRAMQKVGAKPFETLYPGCEEYDGDDDTYFRCQALSVMSAIYHKSGSVKMGNPKDPTTVLDTELRVKGVDGLRVVDASVMPIITSGNTNAPTIMIAEKASDIIKREITQC